MNRSAPSGAIIPSLIYQDVAKAIDWLCDVFGFTERLRVSDPDGKVGHAQLNVGRGGVLLGAARPGFAPPKEVSQSLSVQVLDVDQHYEHAKQRGARIVHAPTTYPYGERQYSADDLEGHRWTFSQTVADVDPKEWGATASNIESELALLPRPRVCYLEIPAIDVHKSAEFYEAVFGWNIRHRDTNRPSFDDATTYVSGAWVTGRRDLLPYIWVDDIQQTLQRAIAEGAEIIKPVDKSSDNSIAIIRDPAGNLIGLYQEHPQP